MFAVVLYQRNPRPTRATSSACVPTRGCELHLVKPLGFPVNSAKMRRAGLDYHEFSRVAVHETFADCRLA